MLSTIAVDAMGGDNAPAAVVQGALDAVADGDGSLAVHLFGRRDALDPLLAGKDTKGIAVIHADDIIGMDESPAAALKKKQRSSIHLGLQAVASGSCSAFVSAGNTGAVMAASMFILGRVPGIQRPAVIGFFPTMKGTCIVIDVGTNVDCRPEHLVQFAVMGTVYAERVMGVTNPVTRLLNVGAEPGKGNELAKEVYPLLEQAEGINFQGNIEGRDVLAHGADVVVCDGFVGNIMLKLGESVASVVPKMLAAAAGATDGAGAGLGSILKKVTSRFDYEEFGGAPLLGVKHEVMIGHGSSSPKAIKNLIRNAANYALAEVPTALEAAMSRIAPPTV